VAGSEHLTVDDRLYNWLAAAEAVTEWGLDWFGIGHKGPMRSGCDRAADMMLIRTGRRPAERLPMRQSPECWLMRRRHRLLAAAKRNGTSRSRSLSHNA